MCNCPSLNCLQKLYCTSIVSHSKTTFLQLCWELLGIGDSRTVVAGWKETDLGEMNDRVRLGALLRSCYLNLLPSSPFLLIIDNHPSKRRVFIQNTTIVPGSIFTLFYSIVWLFIFPQGKVSGVVTSLPIIGGITACGVFLLIISVVGFVGAIKHHQVDWGRHSSAGCALSCGRRITISKVQNYNNLRPFQKKPCIPSNGTGCWGNIARFGD